MTVVHDRTERRRAPRPADPFAWVKEDLIRWGAWASRQRSGGHGWAGGYPAYRLYRTPPDGNSAVAAPINVVDPAHMERLTQLVDRLPEDDRLRTIAVARYRDQWSWRRIHEHVCCSEETLRQRLMRIHREIGVALAVQ